ncbi:hypothetical protein GCM10009414_13470 [Tatumella terrea]|uniref:MauE/DoxX family redox-associated membrane protein n=1 Tax=Tatumella terrea TaxID=419007 RepID=UPI0031CE965A
METDLLSQIHFALLTFLVLLFSQSLLHKRQGLLRFSGYIANYHPVFSRHSYRIAQGLALAEALVLLMSLIPHTTLLGQSGMFALLLIYLSAIGYALITGKTAVECGCGDTPLRVSGRLLLRNILLLLSATGLLCLPMQTTGVLSLTASVCAGGLLWVCYQLFEQLIRNSDLQHQLTAKSSSREGL